MRRSTPASSGATRAPSVPLTGQHPLSADVRFVQNGPVDRRLDAAGARTREHDLKSTRSGYRPGEAEVGAELTVARALNH